MEQPSPLGVNDFRNIQVSPETVARKLNMDEDCEEEETVTVPSARDLMVEVENLQERLQKLGKEDSLRISELKIDERLLDGSPQRRNTTDSSTRTMQYHNSSPELHHRMSPSKTHGIYNTSVGSLSPEKEDLALRGGIRASFTTGMSTPPRRRDTNPRGPCTAPKGTRVAALTRENISLLPAPVDGRRLHNYSGSVCGSQKSRSSVRTDGGAVFSRLYQPDFYKNREAKLRAIRDRQESFNYSFAPRVNRRPSCSSRDSVGSSSVGSMQSSRTDASNVSSRLYDPDYYRKRNARLQRMREEQELRNCSFTPATNSSLNYRASTPTRR